jgi:amidophosphoribosyltransferase
VFGESVQAIRNQLGRRLAVESPVDADVVIAVPDSGNHAALGYSHESGIPLDYGFIRNHYVGRTFIMPEAAARGGSVDMKLSIVPSIVRDKRVVVVDDSIVRGTTARRRVLALREAGAREVHLRISCPPILNPCFFGIDFPSRTDLLAAHHALEDIRTFLGADSIAYLSLDGLLSTVQHPEEYCTGCFSGQYPVTVEGERSKYELEDISPRRP